MKSLNLLVDDNWVTKVSDFGLSRFNTGGQFSMNTLTKLRGTLSYTAPEVYFGEKFTPKADVYALGT
jgi:serine/threonine protein kinase